jgi:hypothetical protein
MIAQGAAHREHGFLIQRIFAGNAADSVSAKKFSHYSVVGPWSFPNRFTKPSTSGMKALRTQTINYAGKSLQ